MARGRIGRWLIGCGLLVAAAVLCGCGEERPADIPRPAPGLLSWFEGDCPDLRGDYRFLAVHGGARARYPGVYWEKQMRRVPRHHTVWSIESLDAERMVIRTAANARDTREGFARWHADNKVAYRKWLEKHDSGGPIGDPSSYPRSSVYTIPGEYYACERGWLVIRDPPRLPGSEAKPLVRMTRAADGGLVVETRGLVGNQLRLWCGARCWKHYDLPDKKHVSWRYAAPSAPADNLPVDWPALIREARKVDERRVQERERAERQRRFQAPLRAEAEESAAIAASVAAAAADAANQAYWRETLPGWLRAGMQLEQVNCGGPKCRAKGNAPSMRDVSDLMRTADEARANPELEQMERCPDGRYSFVLMLDARAR